MGTAHLWDTANRHLVIDCAYAAKTWNSSNMFCGLSKQWWKNIQRGMDIKIYLKTVHIAPTDEGCCM